MPSTNNNTNVIPVKGMHSDNYPKLQPENTYRFALNALQESNGGDEYSLVNELGNTICIKLDKPIVGHCLTHGEDIVLFLAPDEIGIYNPFTCTYVPVLVASCLNFSTLHPIKALFRVRNGCEREVYFTDDFNSYRAINLDDKDLLTTQNPTPNTFDCDRIRFTKAYTHPDISIKVINSGQLKVGTYQLFVRYLDNDLNPTNWINGTNTIPIYDESTTSSYSSVDGALNDVIGQEIIGGVGTANKSIEVTLNNVDLTSTFYQYAVVEYSGAVGIPNRVWATKPTPVNISTTTVDLSSFYSELSIDEVLIDNLNVDKVKTHAQLDGRLFLGNVSEKNRDWSAYQKIASKIKVTWEVRSVRRKEVEDTNAGFSIPKYENTYQSKRGFLTDEIYALGVVFIHKDGSLSPVFHIPGRPANVVTGTNINIPTTANWDTSLVTGDVNIFNVAKTKKWQVYNTATVTETIGNLNTKGELGYYEVSGSNYTPTATCTTNDYWGVDFNNVPLVNTPIRHHRIPDWACLGQANMADNNNSVVSLVFSNMNHSAITDIVGYYFVFGDRAQNKTVLEKGYGKQKSRNSGGVLNIAWQADTLDSATDSAATANVRDFLYVSNEVLFNEQLNRPTYLKLERVHHIPRGAPPTSFSKFNVKYQQQMDFNIVGMRMLPVDFGLLSTVPPRYNYVVNEAFALEPTVYYGEPTAYVNNNGNAIINYSHNNYVGYLSTIDEIVDVPAVDYTERSLWHYISLKQDIDVFTNLNSIDYIPLDYYNSSTNITSGSDIFNTDLSLLDWRTNDLGTDPIDNNTSPITTNAWWMDMLIESPINSALRYESKTDIAYKYFKTAKSTVLEDVANYLRDRFYESSQDDTGQKLFYLEQYLYNLDYTPFNVKRFFPLPFNWDYCDECQGRHLHRIYYSEGDNQEEQTDGYRKIKLNNYKDLFNTGELQLLFVNFDQLYALTSTSLWNLPTKGQTLTTDTNNVYLGTGDVFSTEPRQMKAADYQFGGTTVPFSLCNTEYGAVYVDNLSGNVFHLTNTLTSLSRVGQRAFFENNAELTLNKQFKAKYGRPYPKIATNDPQGIGWTTCYDPRHKRVILAKKDFAINEEFKQDIQYNFGSNRFEIGSAPIDLGQSTYFDNKSFTISYSFITNSWVSFHSYLPNYLFNNYDTFFSDKKDVGMWKHNIGSYQTYYDKKYDHILELVNNTNPYLNKSFDSVFYQSDCFLNDSATNNQTYVETTFDRFWAFNTKQSTGIKTLDITNQYNVNTDILKPFYFDSKPTSSVTRVRDQVWRINELRNYLEGNTAYSTKYSDLISNNNEYYIDKVPVNVNNDKSLFNLERMRDFYLTTRLYFKPYEDLKIVTSLVSTNTTKNEL